MQVIAKLCTYMDMHQVAAVLSKLDITLVVKIFVELDIKVRSKSLSLAAVLSVWHSGNPAPNVLGRRHSCGPPRQQSTVTICSVTGFLHLTTLVLGCLRLESIATLPPHHAMTLHAARH